FAARRNTLVFFFFKQKTAYEIETWLEFRRVLFRSVSCHAGAGPSLEKGARRSDLPLPGSDAPDLRSHGDSRAVAHVRCGARAARAEERRVGKGCRSRCGPGRCMKIRAVWPPSRTSP